jgi:hypothetical protein
MKCPHHGWNACQVTLVVPFRLPDNLGDRRGAKSWLPT